MPRTNEQYEEIRSQKRRLIIEAGLKLFSEQGFANASISQIAKEAGISKGLMYNYFKSKDELLLTILQEGIDSILNLYDLNKDGVLEPEEMEFFIKESFRTVKENRDYWRLYFQVVLQSGVMEMFQKPLEIVYEKIMDMSMRYFARMGFNDPATEAIIFGAMMDGLSLQFVAAPDTFPSDHVQKILIEKYCIPQNNTK